MERILEDAVSTGRFTLKGLFDTDSRKIAADPSSGASPKKYHAAYGCYLDGKIQDILASFGEGGPMVVSAVLMNRTGHIFSP